MSDRSAPPERAGLKESQHIDPPETEDRPPAPAAFLAALSGQQIAGYATGMLVYMTLLLVLPVYQQKNVQKKTTFRWSDTTRCNSLHLQAGGRAIMSVPNGTIDSRR